MVFQRRKVFIVVLAVLAIISAASAASFDRDSCISYIKWQLGNGTLSPDDEVFARYDNGTLRSSPGNPVLTLAGCERLCGKKWSKYTDTGPRLNTFIIPVLILASNLEVSPLDKRKYFMIFHLLGDPIHSLWSLLRKVEAWSQLNNIGNRDILLGTILGAMGKLGDRETVLEIIFCAVEELASPDIDPLTAFHTLLRGWNPDQITELMKKTALELADARTDDVVRTFLAIALYFWQVISAFVTILGGGNSSPPSGRLGTALFLTWIIPIVLLSNIIGGFTSRRTCFNIMQEFADRIQRSRNPENQEDEANEGNVPAAQQGEDISSALGYRDREQYFASQCWDGAIYTYCPPKQQFRGLRSKILLLVLSVLPFVISIVTANATIWYNPPNAFQCRGILLVVLFTVYLISALTTWLTSFCLKREPRPRGEPRLKREPHWYVTLVKDIVITIASLTIIIVSTAGLFNSCWCSSGIIRFGRKRAYVVLNNAPYLDLNNKVKYPVIFALCLWMQVAVFAFMILNGIKGLRLMRWSESKKQALFSGQPRRRWWRTIIRL